MRIEKDTSPVEVENRIPQNKAELTNLRKTIASFIKGKKLIAPIRQQELLNLAKEFAGSFTKYKPYLKLITILINNHSWQSIVASIPYDKRVLLLPRCMQNSNNCKAKIDELGLLCDLCGGCKLSDYIESTEKLGYNVIVSEGTGAVSVLLQSGQIECVIGVACLESFESSFPLSLKNAIPSIAIPLYNADCKDSETDEEWLKEVLYQKNDDHIFRRVDFEDLKSSVSKWFTNEYLNVLFPNKNKSIEIANKWLQAGGKRWRPIIMLALYRALSGDTNVSEVSLAKLAISIESFHKASLAHDDIVDNDTERYDEASLLKKHSLEITLNTGDLLLSYGYQLIADSGLKAEQIQKLILAASVAHRELCVGQGEEILWHQSLKMPSVRKVLDIFANKTAPAFEVALKFGAIAANAESKLFTVLKEYSVATGIAYQIKDDLDDFNLQNLNNDISEFRPSLILAILNEKYPEKMEQHLKQFNNGSGEFANKVYKWAQQSGTIKEAESLLEEYKDRAIRSLDNLLDSSVKVLLYRILNIIVG